MVIGAVSDLRLKSCPLTLGRLVESRLWANSNSSLDGNICREGYTSNAAAFMMDTPC
jgi:hypothetical protein